VAIPGRPRRFLSGMRMREMGDYRPASRLSIPHFRTKISLRHAAPIVAVRVVWPRRHVHDRRRHIRHRRRCLYDGRSIHNRGRGINCLRRHVHRRRRRVTHRRRRTVISDGRRRITTRAAAVTAKGRVAIPRRNAQAQRESKAPVCLCHARQSHRRQSRNPGESHKSIPWARWPGNM
jgi:hypothetical protein